MTKAKIIVICGILVLSVFVGLLIRISLKEPRSKSEQAFAPKKQSVESPKPSSSSLKPDVMEELNVPILPIPKPDLEAVSLKKSSKSTMSFFENINKAVRKVEESLAPVSAPAQNTSTVTSAGIILSLTEDQFHFLYPDKFIAGLTNAQTFLIKEQDPFYEPISKIETDTQVRFVEEKIVTTLLSANMITKEKAEQFITTIRFTLPELQLIDLKKYNSYGLYKSSPFSQFLNAALGTKIESPRTAPKGLFLAELMEKLAEALAHKAQAICGTCSNTGPECFQLGADAPGVAGSELFYPSCYCTGCLTELGCLSANSGIAAIYDQTTGVCGIGLGGGGGVY